MKLTEIQLNTPSMRFSPVGDGVDSLIIRQILSKPDHQFILHVARDDQRMSKMHQELNFCLKNPRVITLPAWDCLPYDRISPNSSVISQRINALSQLAERDKSDNTPTILITSINALIQKFPAAELWNQQILSLRCNDNISMNKVIHFLVNNSYIRTGNVADMGEFAVRGSIIDLFPTGSELAYRIDFFGDTIDSIRTFDPLSQISKQKKEEIRLLPASEILLNEETITNFKQSYRQLFGAVSSSDPLYESISVGKRFIGMEHWMPLFYEQTDSIFNYIPKDSIITFDHMANQAIEERHKLIIDYYESRIEAKQIKHFGESTYNPITPDLLYLTPDEIKTTLTSFNTCYFSSFKEPAGTVEENGIHVASINLDITPTPNFFTESKKQQQTPLMLATNFLYQRILDTTKERARKRIIIGCFTEGTLDRVKRMFVEHDASIQKIDSLDDCKKLAKKTFGLAILPIERGFETENFIFISEQDILGEKILRKSQNRKQKTENFLSEAASLTPDELVVHREHGIGRFIGLETIEVQGQKHDFILLHYVDEDKLYVPVENIDILSRYGADDGVKLDKLGHTAWQMRKAKQKKRIQIAAETLLQIAAERELKKAEIIEPSVGMYEEFCARFPYAETEDQLRTLEEIQDDLSSGKPMDRLVCGDVGFGKTEIALRTAFMAVSSDYKASKESPQVAVIVPTTLLARQHYQTFIERFKDMPIRIATLSRLVSAKEAQKVREQLANGEIDIVIGTHALLAKNMKFNNLSTVIIDEEQHFGVAQKERLKSLCSDIHVLTLTATPIPRTLQMSLSGIKSLSILGTPPIDRLAIRTYVMPFDGMVIREAIMREHYRGGRIFVVCPRIKDLPDMEEKLKTLVPEIKVVVAHGQMSPTKLDDIMNAFYDGKFDLLLATTIVESGLDVPSANTIIIHRADQFGLAQLYQLRGRVGRSNIRAYAYLTLPPKAKPTQNAMKRLEVMQSLDSLGAGFSIASHDMDIRGFGNLVGDEQSGHVREVGIELYQEMLKEAVEKAKESQLKEALSDNELPDEDWSPIINLGLSIMIPENYVADLQLRMGLYKRIAHLQTDSDVEAFAAEMIDRFGTLPDEVQHLLDVVKVKQLCKRAFIEKVDTGPKGAVFTLRNNYFPEPERLLGFISKNSHHMKLRNDYKIVLTEQWHSPEKKLSRVRAFISEMVTLAA